MFWITLKDTLIYWLNGILALTYWLAAHWAALASLLPAGACVWLLDGHLTRVAGERSRRYGRGVVQLARTGFSPASWLPALLWLLAAWLVPAPVPYIGLAMWLAALILPLALPLEKRFLTHRLRWFIAAYAGLGLGFWLLARYSLSMTQAAAWSQLFQAAGSGEALGWSVRSTAAPYLALILWVVYPLTYFGVVAQHALQNRGLLVSPWLSAQQRLADVRARGEA